MGGDGDGGAFEEGVIADDPELRVIEVGLFCEDGDEVVEICFAVGFLAVVAVEECIVGKSDLAHVVGNGGFASAVHGFSRDGNEYGGEHGNDCGDG